MHFRQKLLFPRLKCRLRRILLLNKLPQILRLLHRKSNLIAILRIKNLLKPHSKSHQYLLVKRERQKKEKKRVPQEKTMMSREMKAPQIAAKNQRSSQPKERIRRRKMVVVMMKTSFWRWTMLTRTTGFSQIMPRIRSSWLLSRHLKLTIIAKRMTN